MDILETASVDRPTTTPSRRSSSKGKTAKLTSTVVNSPAAPSVTDPTTTDASNLLSSSGSNSDNSSTDEGIDNPEDVALEDEDDDDEQRLVNLEANGHSHSHHKDHHNHHFQHHRPHRHRHHSGESCSKNSSSAASTSGGTTASECSPLDEDLDQVERYLNGTTAKHHQTLVGEEANLRKEIAELEREQANPKPTSPKSSHNGVHGPTETDLDVEDEEDDEELLEFQAIEREIKLSELRKCLETIQKRIEVCRRQMKVEAEEKNHQAQARRPNLNSAVLEFANMTDSMLEECRQDAAAQVNLLEEELDPKAPLACEDEWDTASLVSSTYTPIPTVQSTKPRPPPPPVPVKPSLKSILHLSDSEDSETDEPEVNNSKSVNNSTLPPKTPPRKASLQSETSTLLGAEAILFDTSEYYRTSLHEDALHESIEQSLCQVNPLSETDAERFIIVKKPPIAPPKTEDVARFDSSLHRRESQYENETIHECDSSHRRGFERIQALNRKLQNNGALGPHHEATANEKSQSLDDLLKSPDKSEEETSLRRRSAKFPTEEEANCEAPNNGTVSFRKRNSDSTNTVNTNGHSQTSLSSNSHRPLTLYLPSPNEELNLITHLHALGHDLTSTIVTNNLLITPFTCSGYLYKQCAGSSTKWRKRYFHFNRVRKVFVYFHDRASFEKRRHPKRGVFFDEMQDVYVDHARMKSNRKFFGGGASSSGHASPSHLSSVAVNSPVHSGSASKGSDGTRCVFVVHTTTMNRKFILSTFSPELMRIWMDVIFTGANAYLQDYEFEA